MANDPNNIDVQGLNSELTRKVDGEVRFDSGSRALYATDASNYRYIPYGVVLPRTKDAVEVAVAICRKFGAPIVSRGGGTGLCGQTVNKAVVIDFSKYLNKVLNIDPQKKLAVVQPGTILDHLRDEAQQKYNLTYGPDPATHTHCTFGGMIGNNSCGIHSVMAGRTVDNVHELEILTYDGLRVKVGQTNTQELHRIIAGNTRQGEIYRNLNDLTNRNADLIRSRYPKIPRRVSGYNLDNLLPENGFHVARALVGSESTCVIVLEATVQLVHSPPKRSLLVLGYHDVFSAGDHIPEIMAFKPLGLEGLDDMLVQFMIRKNLHPENTKLLPEGKGWLLVEFGADTKKEADDIAAAAMDVLRSRSNPPSMKLFTDESEEKIIWKVRESGLGATANVPGMPLSWPGWEDAAVRPDKIGEYLRDFRKLLDKHNLIASLYGHFGQGCIHCRISFDLFSADGIKNYLKFIDEASDLVVKYGGSFSAEHGDGQSKAIFLPKMYGRELMEAFVEFKKIWDPQWKMNPGKVIEPYLPDENLKFGSSYKPWTGETYFKFPEDRGSIARATLRCVGVGDCRRTHDAFMCPSFLATREEEHTTRGRAHVLWEMFRGDFIKTGWKSREVFNCLKLCLACKGCKTECPVNVDIAMYKAEFLAHYYHHRLRPSSAYSMGLIGIWAPIGGKIPKLANFISHAPLLRNLIKAVAGISQKRDMPMFAGQTFSSWAKDRQQRERKSPKVLLYPDPFNDYFYPNSLKAAKMLLEHWAYNVILPRRRPAAIRPLIHYGYLAYARRKLAQILDELKEEIEAGIPVIILEPSTAAVYRDDMLGLFPNNEDAKRLASQVFLLSEFVNKSELPLPKMHGKAVFHGHCHQKAVLNVQAARDVLKKAGLDFIEPQPGCCGMAGSFGLESEHYDISMQIANEHLLPAIRESDEHTYIVADGFSCRTQILEGTGRHALHISELLLLGFQQCGELLGMSRNEST